MARLSLIEVSLICGGVESGRGLAVADQRVRGVDAELAREAGLCRDSCMVMQP